jgi:hypothetical protein
MWNTSAQHEYWQSQGLWVWEIDFFSYEDINWHFGVDKVTPTWELSKVILVPSGQHRVGIRTIAGS